MTAAVPRQAGFTLVEMMTALALSVILLYAIIELAAQAQRDAAATDAGIRRLDGFRSAIAGLATDLRRAESVRFDGEDLVIESDGDTCRWSLAGSALMRSAQGSTTAVAQDVRGLTVTPEGRAWRIDVAVGRHAQLRTTVLPRGGARR